MSRARADPQPIIKTQPRKVKALSHDLALILPVVRCSNATIKDPANFAPDVFREKLDECRALNIKIGLPVITRYVKRAATCAVEAATARILSSFQEQSRRFKRAVDSGMHDPQKLTFTTHLARFNLDCDFQEWAGFVSTEGARSLLVYYGSDSADVASLQSQLIVEGLKQFGQIQLVMSDTDSDGEQDAVFKFVGNLGFTFPIPLPSPPPPCNLVTL